MLDLINEASNVTTDRLFLAILGCSGSGKSHVIGTAPGKILYLYFGPERHGVTAALKSGPDIIAVSVDTKKDGSVRKPDEAYKYGLQCLDPAALKKAGIETVALDGLIELEKLVRNTTEFDDSCLTKAGKRDAFREPAETVRMMDKYMTALRVAQDSAQVHVVVTSILDVSEVEENGAIKVAKPRASGYAVAENMIQQFGDILCIGEITVKGKTGRVFQTGADLKRVSTDENKKVKRFINFNPRIQVPGHVEVPEIIKADLKEVLRLKTGSKE